MNTYYANFIRKYLLLTRINKSVGNLLFAFCLLIHKNFFNYYTFFYKPLWIKSIRIHKKLYISFVFNRRSCKPYYNNIIIFTLQTNEVLKLKFNCFLKNYDNYGIVPRMVAYYSGRY